MPSFNVRKAFKKAYQEYCLETTTFGLKNLVDPKKSKFQKGIWASLHISLVVCAYVMVYRVMYRIYENPIIVSLETANYPIGKIPFPAISICDINRISKKRIGDLVTNIMHHNLILPHEAKFLRTHIKSLGKLFDYGVEDENVFNKLQIILEKYENIFNVTIVDIMKNLSTPCEELLYQCNWKTRDENCSSLFTMRRTYEGFCCTFNYIRQTEKKEEYLNKSDPYHGLTVIVKNNPDDYYYPMLSTVGINVHIFNPGDYPDIQCGSLLEEVVSIGTETFLSLTANSYYTVEEVHKYPMKVRFCNFKEEGEVYSLSNCLIKCRMKSIFTLCQCIPFNIPTDDRKVCFLNDIHCLNKYEEKWQSYKPGKVYLDGEFEFEQQNSLECLHCYPECDGTNYRVSSFFAPLHVDQKSDINENFSVVHIYFERPYINRYVKDVVLYWFEILSNVGGLFGLFIGVSLISIIELLFFMIIRFLCYLVSPGPDY